MKKDINYYKQNSYKLDTEQLKNLIIDCPIINNTLANKKLQHKLLIDIFNCCLDKISEYDTLLKMQLKEMVNVDDLNKLIEFL